VTLQFVSSRAAASAESGGELGGTLLGAGAGAACPDWPVQRISAPLPGSTAAVVAETWRAGTALAAGSSEGIAWRRAGDLLYGVLDLDEAAFAGDAACPPLQAASAEAYRRIFRLLDAQGLPHLWRVWNYLDDINAVTHGLERYRQFNIGRQDAFLDSHRGATGNVPAACAIGLAGGPLSVAFLAGATPALAVENPRQVSAYLYPVDYGPRSPTFSRAVLALLPGQEVLFVSGTASIVGHRTMHAGDAAAQCRETIANIAAVVAEASRVGHSQSFVLGDLAFRVYLRHAADFPVIRATLGDLLGAGADIVYVQADICRADLLLEIEAFVSHNLETC
jgi:enamine deaminase RidA (YjgF/YER057c/UK114 family)